MSRNNIIAGAAVLTFASIITRILGFIYRIYMSNLIGAEGMGLYQLIMPIYMLCWSVTSSGFTTTVSKLTAQEYAKKAYGNMGRLLKASVIMSCAVSLVITVILFFFSSYVAIYIVKDVRVFFPLKVLSLCFPFMAAGSCIRGYFNGLHENTIPAVSQVFEQTVRMVTVFALSTAFISKGVTYACTAAVIGIVLGEILSFILVFVWYKRFKRIKGLNKKPSWPIVKTCSFILTGAIPLTASRLTSSLLATIENILIPQKLQLYGGGTSEALRQYGLLTGMALPLIAFPSAILMSISITLVPTVSEAVAKRNIEKISLAVAKSLMFTTIVGIGASSLFIIFPNEIGISIFNQKELGIFLFSLGFICPFYYMQITMSGVLNGLSEQVFIFKINLLSSAINIFSVIFFIPVYGISAFIISWLVSIIFVCCLCLARICKRTGLRFDIKNWIYKPIISALAAGLAARYISINFFFKVMNYRPAAAASVIFLALLYSMFVYSLDAISKEDVIMITKSIRH